MSGRCRRIGKDGRIPLRDLRELYHRDYFLSDCEGHVEFAKSSGRRLPRRLAKCRQLIGAKPGEKILDLGCGRGELSMHLVLEGCTVVAVDVSLAALRLVGEARDRWRDGGEVARLCARMESLPFRSGWADAVVLADALEHLPRAAGSELLKECRRVLRPGGRLVIHTQPNRLLVDCAVPFLSRISWLWGVQLPRDLRIEMSRGSQPEYHPNEQSRRRLKRSLCRHGFVVEEIWLEGSYPVHRIFGDARFKPQLLALFRRSRLLKEVLASQIFARAESP